MVQKYSFSEIFDIVTVCLSKIGIIIDDTIDNKDIDLLEYGIDSVTYVTLIIELEDAFHIEFPEVLLSYEILHSLNGFVNLISEIINQPQI